MAKDQVDMDLVVGILKEVEGRIGDGAEEYEDLYVVNDMQREIREEAVDIVAWTALMCARFLEKRGPVSKFDQGYWKGFFERQNADFLLFLREGIEDELEKRRQEDGNSDQS